MSAQITHLGKATLVLASMLADNNLAIQAQGSLANKYSTGWSPMNPMNTNSNENTKWDYCGSFVVPYFGSDWEGVFLYKLRDVAEVAESIKV